MKIHFTDRMRAIADLIEPTETLADIGADHGLMSIYIAEHNLAKTVYACDVNELPLNKAKANIIKSGLLDKVIPVLSDGLSFVCDKADTVLIAGLGGEVISEILKKDDISKIKTFILQPMTRADKLRETLVLLGLKIDKEVLVSDAGKIYSIIKASHGKAEYSPLEILAGPFILKEKGELFTPYIEKIIRYEESKAKGEDGEGHRALADELKSLLKE